jgi:tetratricopeptide (TPR) repeat protein
MKTLLLLVVAVALCGLQVRVADAQGYPGGGGMGGGMGGGGRGQMPPGAGGMPDEPPTVADPKPDVAAKKALKSAAKSFDKAKALEAEAAAARDPDKKAKLMERVSDEYNAALDAYTEALSNKSDLVEAWDQVGFIHLRLGAYREAVDDYNHTLALKPELMEAIEHRAEAYLAIDHLDEVKIAYMDLYNHTPDLAAQLMAAMQKWLAARQADASGSHNAEAEAFSKWVSDRDGIAKQTASLPH